jgi:hypothetical protein
MKFAIALTIAATVNAADPVVGAAEGGAECALKADATAA